MIKKRITSAIFGIMFCFILSMHPVVACNQVYAAGIREFFAQFFENQNQPEMPEVYVGGIPLGFTLSCKGVVIIAVGGVHTQNGLVSTIKEGSIDAGDIVTHIDGIEINSAYDISEQMGNQSKENRIVVLNVEHENKSKLVQILPAKDIITGDYKLGLWIRDNSAGVGTLTYVREDNGRFGALGHSVCDIDTGTHLPVSGGRIYKCNIIGIRKSISGTAGELRGLFLKSGTMLGKVDKNTQNGVYGTADAELLNMLNRKVKVARKSQVKTGKASILCTLDGCTPKEYSVEIIKTSKQSKSASKSMVIRILDQELLATTGGIVQGMSGSSIIQNSMLVGSITHVFISDPSKGYGVYAEWMIDE